MKCRLADFGEDFRERYGQAIPSRYLLFPPSHFPSPSSTWYFFKANSLAEHRGKDWIWIKHPDHPYCSLLSEQEAKQLLLNLLVATEI